MGQIVQADSLERLIVDLQKRVSAIERTKMVIEPWHYVGTAGEPAFGTNVINFDGGTPPNARSVRFKKTPLGQSILQGLVGCSVNIGVGAVLFTLPTGYRPYTDGTISGGGGHYLAFATVIWNGGGFAPGYVRIQTNGEVHTETAFNVGWGIWLDGLNFMAA